MQDQTIQIRSCPECRDGRITLLASVVQCDRCGGTGIELVSDDERLQRAIDTADMRVRTQKVLSRHGVRTLGQLLRATLAGRLPEWCRASPSCLVEFQQLLSDHGLSTEQVSGGTADPHLEDLRRRNTDSTE